MSYLKQKKEWLAPIAIGLFIGLIAVSSKYWPAIQIFKPQPTETSYADIIEPVLPFTVSIFTNREATNVPQAFEDDPYFSKYFADKSSQQTSLGSGIVFNKSGMIVTNAHVVRSADQIIVVTTDNKHVSVIRTIIDPESDIAVLETNLRITAKPPTNQDHIVRVGDIAFTIGNPFGIGQSISMGIISATGRQQPGLTNLTDFIQTDASINPGNSGGALVNASGEIIGMNTAIISSTGGTQGIGFAIPYQHVEMIANELINNGMVTRGYMGIDVTEIPSLQSSPAKQLKIISVAKDSPAEQAGIQKDDILLAINNTPLSNRREAARLISQLMPGKNTNVEILRDGQRLEIMIALTVRN